MPEWDDPNPAWAFSVASAAEAERQRIQSERDREEDPVWAAKVAAEEQYIAARRKPFQPE
jgi:hypothetical protein